MTIKTTRSGGAHDQPAWHESLGDMGLRGGALTDAQGNALKDTSAYKPNFEGMGGVGDDGYDAMKDRRLTGRSD